MRVWQLYQIVLYFHFLKFQKTNERKQDYVINFERSPGRTPLDNMESYNKLTVFEDFRKPARRMRNIDFDKQLGRTELF